MKSSTPTCFALSLTLLGVAATSAPTQTTCEGLLPDPAHPAESCTYTHVEYAQFSYNGSVRATWSSQYEVLEAYIVADWEIVSSYSPGALVALPIDTSKTRYDFVGRFREIGSGQVFNALTPIWCVSSGTLPPPLEGCFSGYHGNECTHTESARCADGTTISVTCSGDNGTCTGNGSDGSSVTCTASKTTTQTTTTGGTETSTTTIVKKETCPR